eukprot:COSAG01_NODE_1820_length_9152_cov_22.869215_11_plen_178_part_00
MPHRPDTVESCHSFRRTCLGLLSVRLVAIRYTTLPFFLCVEPLCHDRLVFKRPACVPRVLKHIRYDIVPPCALKFACFRHNLGWHIRAVVLAVASSPNRRWGRVRRGRRRARSPAAANKAFKLSLRALETAAFDVPRNTGDEILVHKNHDRPRHIPPISGLKSTYLIFYTYSLYQIL